MIEHLVTYMQVIISEYGAWGVFIATLIEEIIAPVPSPIVPLAAGFFLLSAGLPFVEMALKAVVLIALPVSVGISIGSALVYALGFFGGKPVIEKSGTWTGIKWRDIEEAETRLSRGRRDEITLFTLRILPIVPGVAISGLCGAVRYPFKKFITITYLGAFVRAIVLGIVGWQVGEVYATYADMISKYEKYILLVVVLIVLILLGYYVATKIARSRQA